MATAMRQQAVRLGFKRKTVVVASGEAVSYLEKEPSRDQDRNKPPLVCLHGLTASKERALFNCGDRLFELPSCRVLVPDLQGHGERTAHTVARAMRANTAPYSSSSSYGRWSLTDRAVDLDAFFGRRCRPRSPTTRGLWC